MERIPKQIRLYVFIVVFLGLAVLAYLSYQLSAPKLWEPIFWGALIVLTTSLPIPLPRGGASITVTSALDFAIILLFGPGVAAWLGGVLASIVLDGFVAKKPLWRIEFNISQLVLSIGVAGMVYKAFGGEFNPVDYSQTILPFIPCVIAFFIINTGLVSVAVGLIEQTSPLRIWTVNFSWTAVNLLALGPLGLLLALVYLYIGPWAVFICLAPIVLARYSFKLYMDLRHSYATSIAALSSALDASDSYTYGHSDRVATNSEQVARALGLPEKEVERIKFAAQLHDIGKIGVASNILHNPGKLSQSDWEEMQKHPDKGAMIVKGLQPTIFDIVQSHQEHYNGTGYPFKLKGAEIPMGARIIHVADAFDAMTSDRPYRPAFPVDEAVAELKRESGKQFDPQVVEAFVEQVVQGTITAQNSKGYLKTEMPEKEIAQAAN